MLEIDIQLVVEQHFYFGNDYGKRNYVLTCRSEPTCMKMMMKEAVVMMNTIDIMVLCI